MQPRATTCSSVQRRVVLAGQLSRRAPPAPPWMPSMKQLEGLWDTADARARTWEDRWPPHPRLQPGNVARAAATARAPREWPTSTGRSIPGARRGRSRRGHSPAAPVPSRPGSLREAPSPYVQHIDIPHGVGAGFDEVLGGESEHGGRSGDAGNNDDGCPAPVPDVRLGMVRRVQAQGILSSKKIDEIAVTVGDRPLWTGARPCLGGTEPKASRRPPPY